MSTVTHAEPLGRITGIQSGSLQNLSYQWDHLGNLTYRSDNLSSGNVSESFGYDILNRLLSAQVTNGSSVQPALNYGYDALGNIISKSDTGSYTYGATRPHAVTSISGPAGGTYSYDANGNMNNRNGTVITWNSDNMPTTITQNGSNSSSFSYAPDKHRYYQSAMIASVSETTVYVGAYEAVTTGGITKYRHHLMADGREVTEVDLSNSGSSVTEKISYILSDHLGSVDVVQTVDVNGNPLSTTSMSFSAWGGRREPSSWLPPVTQAEAQADHTANRYGFTHQEMLDNVALIHMNGRVYDPSLGRFLSVDPVFQFPTNTQSLNPYSYVLNNPLSMTDPTGYTVAAACPTGQTCPADHGIKPGDTATKTIKTTTTPTGSHIAQTTTTTLTGVAQKDGSVAVYSSTSTQNGGSNSQGPASGTTLATSTNQGGNTSPGTTARVTTANAVTGGNTGTLSAPFNPQDATYKIANINEKWKDSGKVTVSQKTIDKTKVTVISIRLNISGPHAAAIADAVNREWNGSLGVTDEKFYLADVHLTAVSSNGDWQVRYFTPDELRVLGTETGGFLPAGENNWGSSLLKISSGWNSDPYVPGHEFGHALGMTHAPAGSGSIMSYDPVRAVRATELQDIANGYSGN